MRIGAVALKAILFDLDNTLLDFSGFKRESAFAAAKAMKKAGITLTEKDLYERIFKEYDCIKPRQKVIQVLSSLKRKYKLGIVTDAPREKAWQRLVLSGLDALFYPVVTYNDTLEHKPSLKPFELALFLMKVKPEEVLFVGDNPERDTISAKKVGLHTCLAEYGCIDYSEELNVADFTIKRFEELRGTVNTLDD
ncbi:MAG: HAD family hydrolase [Candidatus Micrarchaeota archaeon]|nr:HAD family hydrolase [Candidatus Micrarchaeota archaeon]